MFYTSPRALLCPSTTQERKDSCCPEEPFVVCNRSFGLSSKKQSHVFLCAIYPDVVSKRITYMYRDLILLPVCPQTEMDSLLLAGIVQMPARFPFPCPLSALNSLSPAICLQNHPCYWSFCPLCHSRGPPGPEPGFEEPNTTSTVKLWDTANVWGTLLLLLLAVS